MKIAVLPFNTSADTDPAYGRQVSFLLSEALKVLPDMEILPIAYLARVEQGGREQVAFVSMAQEMSGLEWPQQVISETESQYAIDGYMDLGDRLHLKMRISRAGEEQPMIVKSYDVDRSKTISALATMLRDLHAEMELPESEEYRSIAGALGTESADAFLALLLGWDALNYIERAGDKLPTNFDFVRPFESLLESVRLDPDFVAPYEALMGLARQCLMAGLGDVELIERTVQAATVLVEDDWRGWYTLGDLFQRTGRAAEAQAAYEKALLLNPAEASVWVRHGLMLNAQDDAAGAEKSFREALTREADHEEKTAAPYLATLLAQTGRMDEAMEMWKGLRDADPASAANWAGLAMSLKHMGQADVARMTLEEALESVTDPGLIHRHLATLLTEMASHADALEHFEKAPPYQPYDHDLMWQYARCLDENGKSEELQNVLRQILSYSPPPDLRARTAAWQMELEHPERLTRFNELAEELISGEAEKAVAELEQLSRWLGDYWKLWLALAHGHNKLGNGEKALAAVDRLAEIFPGCEPAFGEMCQALFSVGRSEDAYQRLRHAAVKYPTYLVVMANLGMAAKLTGRLDEAKLIVDRLRFFAGANPELLNLIERLEEGL